MRQLAVTMNSFEAAGDVGVEGVGLRVSRKSRDESDTTQTFLDVLCDVEN